MAQLSVSVDRWRYLGGSDVPIMMNLSSFKTRWQLLQEKARITEDEFEGNAYTEYGNEMEKKIRGFVNVAFDRKFVEGKHYMKFEDADVRIHTDGEDKFVGEILEVKTTSKVSNDIAGYKHYLVQLLFYMMMLNYRTGKLAVYKRPDDFSTIFDAERLQVFEIDIANYADLVNEIEAAIQLFISDLEKLKENPYLTQADLLSEDESELAMRLVSLKEQKANLDAITDEIKDVEKKLQEVMKKNGHKTFDGFGWKVTSVAPTAEREVEEEYLDVDGLKRDLPELFKPAYDGGYMMTRKVKKGGRAGFIKTIRHET